MFFVLISSQIGWAFHTDNSYPDVSIKIENATLVAIFSELNHQTDYKFSYGESIISDKTEYSISKKKEQLNVVLNDLSDQANLSYTVNNKLVLVKKNQEGGKTLSVNEIVKGKIVDENNQPLPGANIVEAGTTNGVITDMSGEFSIKLSGISQKLIISFIGYETKKLLASENMFVQIYPSTANLNEVMIIGYGSQTKADVTGALSKISEENFRQGINTSADNLLQGKIPGVRIINSSGEPGAGVDVMIRGAGSIRSGSTPLFVIDGVPLSNDNISPGGPNGGVGSSRSKNPLNFLNPSDIESINVLKDASAAAIYGARGSNGVIIITTKKGRGNKATFTLDSYIGISQVANKIDLLNGPEYLEAYEKHVSTDHNLNSEISTDWQDAIFRSALTKSNNLSLSNSTKSGNYFVSVSHLNQEGIIKENSFERLSGRINVMESYLDNQRLKIKINLTASETTDNGIPTSENAGATGELITHTLKASPLRPIYDENGELFDFDTEGSYNPLYMLDFFDDQTKTLRVLGNIETKFRIVNGLEYQFNYGIDRSNSERNTTYYPNTTEIESTGAYYQQNYETFNYLLEHYITYTHTKNDNKFDALAGFSYQKFDRSGTQFGLTDINDNGINPANNPSVGGNQEAIETTGFAEVNEIESYFGRINYSYKSKYLATVSFRADGSTRFGENNKYGYFPSVALGWNISRERFLENSNLIQNLKIRTSWGQTGNQEVPNKITQETYSVSSSNGYYLYGEDQKLTDGITYTRTANPDLKWEVVTQLNIGVDYDLLKGRIFGSLDYYNKTTTDAILLLPAIQPNFSNVWTNMDGEIVNKGFEFTIGSHLVKTKNLSWTIDFNGATLDNEVKNLPVSEILSGSVSGSGVSGETVNVYKNGYAAGSFYLKHHLGFDDEGNSIYSDEKVITESALPTFTYGFNSQFRFKRFELSLSLTGQEGAYLFNNTKSATNNMSNLSANKNITKDVLNSGQSKDDALIISDYYLESSDYLRLNSLRIGYTLNTDHTNWLSQVTIYATGQNLFTITDYSGYDPSVNTTKNVNGNSSLGMDYASYPSSRSYLFGATIKF